MGNYNKIGNYVLFEELNPDFIGKNFRAGELEDGKIKNHIVLSEVFSAFYSDPKLWKRIRILLDGTKKSNITGLYSPDKIITMGEKQMLIFPYKEFVSFDSLLGDSSSKGIPINFDLAFSIATTIADLLDIGSSIVISGKKSFHGFLTPDNILIDFEGKVYLKNYCIYPYLDKESSILNSIEKQYGSWLTPEFYRREKIVPQSDIYHLGYLLFKMLTGQYFSFTPGEDFDAKLENISFSQHIHESNKDFISGLQDFFKKTLHPDPTMRFANIKEFKEFISKTFNTEELSSVTFNLAYFMDSLYSKERNELQEKIKNETKYTPIQNSNVNTNNDKVDTDLVETILSGLDKHEKTVKPKFFMIIAAIIIAGIAIGSYFFIQSNKGKLENLRKIEQAKLLEAQKKQKRLQDKLKEIEMRETKNKEELAQKEEEKKKFIAQLNIANKEAEKLKKMKEDILKKEEEKRIEDEKEAERKRKKEEEDLRKAEEARQRQEEIKKKKAAEEALKPKRGELLPLTEVDKKPVKLSGKNPVFSPAIRSRYSGNKFEASTMCLVDDNGIVKSVKVLNNVPKGINKAISRAILKWKFSPAVKKGIPVKVWLQIKLNISI